MIFLVEQLQVVGSKGTALKPSQKGIILSTKAVLALSNCELYDTTLAQEVTTVTAVVGEKSQYEDQALYYLPGCMGGP